MHEGLGRDVGRRVVQTTEQDRGAVHVGVDRRGGRSPRGTAPVAQQIAAASGPVGPAVVRITVAVAVLPVPFLNFARALEVGVHGHVRHRSSGTEHIHEGVFVGAHIGRKGAEEQLSLDEVAVLPGTVAHDEIAACGHGGGGQRLQLGEGIGVGLLHIGGIAPGEAHLGNGAGVHEALGNGELLRLEAPALEGVVFHIVGAGNGLGVDGAHGKRGALHAAAGVGHLVAIAGFTHLEAGLNLCGRRRHGFRIKRGVIAVVHLGRHGQIRLTGNGEQVGRRGVGGLLARARRVVDAAPAGHHRGVIGRVQQLVLALERGRGPHDDVVVVSVVVVAIHRGRRRAARAVPAVVGTVTLARLGVEQLAVLVIHVGRIGGVAVQIHESRVTRRGKTFRHLSELHDHLGHVAVEPLVLGDDHVLGAIPEKRGQVVGALAVGVEGDGAQRIGGALERGEARPGGRAREHIGAGRARIVFYGDGLDGAHRRVDELLRQHERGGVEAEGVGDAAMARRRLGCQVAQGEGGSIHQTVVRVVGEHGAIARSQLAHVGDGFGMVLRHVGEVGNGVRLRRVGVIGIVVGIVDGLLLGRNLRVALFFVVQAVGRRDRAIALARLLNVGAHAHVGTHRVQRDVQATRLRRGMGVIAAGMVGEGAGVPGALLPIGAEGSGDVLFHHAEGARAPVLDEQVARRAGMGEVAEAHRGVDEVVAAPRLLGDEHVAIRIARDSTRGKIAGKRAGIGSCKRQRGALGPLRCARFGGLTLVAGARSLPGQHGQFLAGGHGRQVFHGNDEGLVAVGETGLGVAIGHREVVPVGHLEQALGKHHVIGREAHGLVGTVAIHVVALVGHAARGEQALAHGGVGAVVAEHETVARAGLTVVAVGPAARVVGAQGAGKGQTRRGRLAIHIQRGIGIVVTRREAAHERARRHLGMGRTHVAHNGGVLRLGFATGAAAPGHVIPLVVLVVGRVREDAVAGVLPARNAAGVGSAEPAVAGHGQIAIGIVGVTVEIHVGIGVDTGAHPREVHHGAREVALVPQIVGQHHMPGAVVLSRRVNGVLIDGDGLLGRHRRGKGGRVVVHLDGLDGGILEQGLGDDHLARLEAGDHRLVLLLVVLVHRAIDRRRRGVIDLVSHAHAQLGGVQIGTVNTIAVHGGVVAQTEAEARAVGLGDGGLVGRLVGCEPFGDVRHCVVVEADVAELDLVVPAIERAVLVVAEGDRVGARREILCIGCPSADATAQGFEGTAIIADLQDVRALRRRGPFELERARLGQVQRDGHVLVDVVDVPVRPAHKRGTLALPLAEVRGGVGAALYLLRAAVLPFGGVVGLHGNVREALTGDGKERALRGAVGLLGILVACLGLGQVLPSRVRVHRRELRRGVHEQIVVIVLAMVGGVGLQHTAGGGSHGTAAVVGLHGGAVHQPPGTIPVVTMVAAFDLGVVHRAAAGGGHDDDAVVIHILARTAPMGVAVVAAVLAGGIVRVTITRANRGVI